MFLGNVYCLGAARAAIGRGGALPVSGSTHTKLAASSAQAQAGMRRQSLRVELRLDGELKARYQGRYLEIAECGERTAATEKAVSKPVRKDHNRGGKSSWMDGFFDRPSPPLWKALGG